MENTIFTIGQFTEMFLKFWNLQKDNVSDYPSKDITFEDGSELKFHIQPSPYFGTPTGIITYVSDNTVFETKQFHPTESCIRAYLEKITKGKETLQKPVREIYDNIVQ